MTESEIMIAYLKAKIIALKAEKTVRQDYCMNPRFQLEFSVINKTIIQIESEIIKLENSK